MVRMRTAVALGAACTWAALMSLAPSAQETAPAGAQPGGAKLTAEEIVAYQAKNPDAGNAEAGRPIYEKQ